MRMRRRELSAEEFQMAPMIDMVFLLLVFFMCVSSLAQADKRTPVELPESWRDMYSYCNAVITPIARPLRCSPVAMSSSAERKRTFRNWAGACRPRWRRIRVCA